MDEAHEQANGVGWLSGSRGFEDGISVLFVDDESDNRLVLTATFRRRFRCLAVESGPAALTVLAREPVAVLVTDQRMPGMSGVDLCEIVRRRWPGIRRVMLSADATRAAALEAINRGQIHAFVDKPWTEAALEATIRVGLAEVAAERAADALRQSLEARARLEATEAAHRALLHDLASATGMADLGFDALVEWLDTVQGQLSPSDVAHARDLLDGLRHGLDFAGDLLAQLRIKPDGLQRRPESLQVLHLVELAVRVATFDQRIGVRFDIDPGLHVRADRVAASRILINLLQNAAQAMRRTSIGQLIAIVAHEARADADSPPMVELTIHDDGPGVDAALRSRIFEPGVSTRPDSQGEGLPLARSLAIEEGGSLELVEAGGAPGATFRLTLPAAEATRSAPSWPQDRPYG